MMKKFKKMDDKMLNKFLKDCSKFNGPCILEEDNKVYVYKFDFDMFGEDGYIGDGIYLEDIQEYEIFTIEEFLNNLIKIYYIEFVDIKYLDNDRKILDKYML